MSLRHNLNLWKHNGLILKHGSYYNSLIIYIAMVNDVFFFCFKFIIRSIHPVNTRIIHKRPSNEYKPSRAALFCCWWDEQMWLTKSMMSYIHIIIIVLRRPEIVVLATIISIIYWCCYRVALTAIPLLEIMIFYQRFHFMIVIFMNNA